MSISLKKAEVHSEDVNKPKLKKQGKLSKSASLSNVIRNEKKGVQDSVKVDSVLIDEKKRKKKPSNGDDTGPIAPIAYDASLPPLEMDETLESSDSVTSASEDVGKSVVIPTTRHLLAPNLREYKKRENTEKNTLDPQYFPLSMLLHSVPSIDSSLVDTVRKLEADHRACMDECLELRRLVAKYARKAEKRKKAKLKMLEWRGWKPSNEACFSKVASAKGAEVRTDTYILLPSHEFGLKLRGSDMLIELKVRLSRDEKTGAEQWLKQTAIQLPSHLSRVGELDYTAILPFVASCCHSLGGKMSEAALIMMHVKTLHVVCCDKVRFTEKLANGIEFERAYLRASLVNDFSNDIQYFESVNLERVTPAQCSMKMETLLGHCDFIGSFNQYFWAKFVKEDPLQKERW